MPKDGEVSIVIRQDMQRLSETLAQLSESSSIPDSKPLRNGNYFSALAKHINALNAAVQLAGLKGNTWQDYETVLTNNPKLKALFLSVDGNEAQTQARKEIWEGMVELFKSETVSKTPDNLSLPSDDLHSQALHLLNDRLEQVVNQQLTADQSAFIDPQTSHENLKAYLKHQQQAHSSKKITQQQPQNTSKNTKKPTNK